jgi:hypothetical protein
LAPFERNAVDTSLRQFPQNQVEAVIAVCYNRFIKSGYEKRFLPAVIFGWEALPRMSIWGLCHISKICGSTYPAGVSPSGIAFFLRLWHNKENAGGIGPPAAKEKGRDAP